VKFRRFRSVISTFRVWWFMTLFIETMVRYRMLSDLNSFASRPERYGTATAHRRGTPLLRLPGQAFILWIPRRVVYGPINGASGGLFHG
jgi:hypothetical protein